MNEIDREIGLVLLKRLWQRNFISEDLYHSASHSRFFDRKHFTQTFHKIAGVNPAEYRKLYG